MHFNYLFEFVYNVLFPIIDVFFKLVYLSIVNSFEKLIALYLPFLRVLNEVLRILDLLNVVFGVLYVEQLFVLVLLIQDYVLQILLHIYQIDLVICFVLVSIFFYVLSTALMDAAQGSWDERLRKLSSVDD